LISVNARQSAAPDRSLLLVMPTVENDELSAAIDDDSFHVIGFTAGRWDGVSLEARVLTAEYSPLGLREPTSVEWHVATEVAQSQGADSLVRQTFSDMFDVVPCVIEELSVPLSRPQETA
jgi:hypothetical protein